MVWPTVDGERGRGLRLPHHVLCHTRIGTYVSGDHAADLQGVVLTHLVSGNAKAPMNKMFANIAEMTQGADKGIKKESLLG